MTKIDEAVIGRNLTIHPAKHLLNKNIGVLHNNEYYEDCKVVRLIKPDKVEVYIPSLDEKIITHVSLISESVNLVSTLRYMQSKSHEKKGGKEMSKFKKTGKNIHAKKALDHFDKAEDLELLAHANTKAEKSYIKNRRDEITSDRIRDYLDYGVGKEYFEV